MSESTSELKISKHGCPNDWREARMALMRRKIQLNQRNQQIRDLKFRNERLKKSNAALMEAAENVITKYEASPDGPLGKGFVNGDFFRLRDALAQAKDLQ